MNVAVRAATESGALAFVSTAIAVATLYSTIVGVHGDRAIVASVALGSVAFVTVFLSVLVSVGSRFPARLR